MIHYKIALQLDKINNNTLSHFVSIFLFRFVRFHFHFHFHFHFQSEPTIASRPRTIVRRLTTRTEARSSRIYYPEMFAADFVMDSREVTESNLKRGIIVIGTAFSFHYRYCKSCVPRFSIADTRYSSSPPIFSSREAAAFDKTRETTANDRVLSLAREKTILRVCFPVIIFLIKIQPKRRLIVDENVQIPRYFSARFVSKLKLTRSSRTIETLAIFLFFVT